jgi:hypothetical protein
MLVQYLYINNLNGLFQQFCYNEVSDLASDFTTSEGRRIYHWSSGLYTRNLIMRNKNMETLRSSTLKYPLIFIITPKVRSNPTGEGS